MHVQRAPQANELTILPCPLPCWNVRSIESVARVIEVLRIVTHNGFPVFMRESDLEALGGLVPGEESQRLEGLILRSQLLVLLQRRHFCDAEGRPVGVALTPCTAHPQHCFCGGPSPLRSWCCWKLHYFKLTPKGLMFANNSDILLNTYQIVSLKVA